MFKSVLLTNLDWSRLLHIGHVCRRVFMERDKVDIHNNAKRTRPISAADPGKGPGRPAPPSPSIPRPLCLEQNEARTAGKFVFGPPPLPYLKIWICHCISCHLTEQAWSINDLLHGQKEKVVGERPVGRERQVQSEHRICLTLPAGRVSHIQLI